VASIYHIVAVSGDPHSGRGVIGKNNALPWPKYPEDLKFFKAMTTGHTIMMGRKTWESIGSKALPNRENIVISRSLEAPGTAKIARSIKEGLDVASNEKIFIIGGAELYKQTLSLAKGLYVTHVPGDYAGDVYYPAIPKQFKYLEAASDELEMSHKIKVQYYENTERKNAESVS
jgi:dihydrofolate reductase